MGAEFDVRLGKMLDAARNVGEPKPYLGNRSVQWGHIDVNDPGMVPLTRAEQLALRLRSGDLLVCEGGEVGRAAIWRDQLPECYYQKALHRLRPRNGYSPELMAAYLRLWSDRGALADYVTQTSIAHLPREKLVTVPLPRPPATEQRAITAALSDVDALLTKLDQLIAKKRDLKQAAMQQLLTGVVRLLGFADGWREVTIGDVADVKTGPFGSALHESDYVDNGTPIITVEHLGERSITRQNLPMVSDEDCRRLRAYSLQPGDVVFSRVGSIDRNALVTESESGWLFSGRLLRVRVRRDRADPSFLSHQFHSEPFKQRVREVAVGQTMPSLNTQILRRLPVALPTLAEQGAIAQVLSDMDTELAALEARREKTRQLKQGMMQALLTGRIRLV